MATESAADEWSWSGAGGHDTVEELLRHRFAELLGGWRGALESAVPTVAFVVVWMLRGELRTAVVASLAAVAALAVPRLARGQTVRYVLSSVVPTAIAAVVALRTGRAEDAFLPGIVWNVALGLVFGVSVLVRWPLLGFAVAAADPEAVEEPAVFVRWRRHAGMVTVCSRLTAILAGLMAARVAIMVPLYLAEKVALLGVAKVVLGWPAYALVVAGMGLLLLKGHTPLDAPEDESPRRPQG